MNVTEDEFDSTLFGFKVGRLSATASGDQSSIIMAALQKAHSDGFHLIYIFGPTLKDTAQESHAGSTVPGFKVDVRTEFSCRLRDLDPKALVKAAYLSPTIRVVNMCEDSAALRKIALAAGEWSRYRTDPWLPKSAFHDMYEQMLTNSINRSFADEMFVARNVENGQEAGLITVKTKGSNVQIGLLAVLPEYRQQGIGSMLLSRAALWALENIGWQPEATISVITQGRNYPACQLYRKFGLHVVGQQDVHHAWLPQHLMEPLSRGDTGPVPFCRQHIVGQEATYVAQVLSTGLDSASRFTNMCASRVQSLLGPESSRVLITPSCTAALEMAALLCDLQPGDEVIMPSFTFSSTANAFVLRGAVPVFVDVRADTLNIDEALIDAAVTAKTRAICCVHYAGVPCEMDAICSIARRHGLLVVEDAAQGFLSTYKGRQLGSIGDFGCISFHYTKNVICGEGGALSINRSSERARRALLVWEKGTNRYDFLMGKIDKYEWVDVGSSHVPNEVSCAILNAQLERCEEITAKRVANHARYLEGFKDLIAQGVFRVPHVPPGCTINGHIFFLVFPSTDVKEQFAAGLKAAGITAFSHYSPLHSSVAGLKYGRASGRMEITSSVHARLLRLPMWPGLSSVEAASIIDMVHKLSARFVQSRTS